MDGNAKKPRKPWSPEARARHAVIARAFWAKRKGLQEVTAVDRGETRCVSQSSPATPAQVKLDVRIPFRPSREVRIPEWAQGAKTKAQDLTIGQRVFHYAFFHGKLVALDGNNASVQVTDPNGNATDVVVDVSSLITLSQAKPVCDAVWKRGKSWRIERGLWLWVVRELCEHGEWEAILKENGDYPKSSANHYIREFKKEDAREVQARQLNDKAKQADRQTAKFEPFEAPMVGESQSIPPVDDPAKDERNENAKVESGKGLHVVPTPDKATLSFQRRNLDPQTVALFHKLEKADKKRIAEIKDHRIDELIVEVLALTPILLPAEAMLATTADSTVAAPETRPAPIRKVDDAIAVRIRARLRKEGATRKEVAGIKFNPELSYQQQYISALKQLP